MTVNNIPATRPNFSANFFLSQKLPPQITFTRASTGTFTNNKALVQNSPVNVPRFGWLNGVSQGLLVEGERTNMARNSTAMSPDWGNNITNNAAISPDGTQNANQITPAVGTDGEVGRVIQGMTSQTQLWSVSFYVKGGTGTIFNNIRVSFQSQYQFDLDLENGTVGGTNFGVVREFFEVGNGWWYCSAVDTGWDSNRQLSFQLVNQTGGDGTNSFFLWGVQAEMGGCSTSYIPTGASTVTRAAEVVQITGNDFTSWYRQGEGSVVASVTVPLCEDADQSFYQMAYGNAGSNAATNIKLTANNQIRLNSKVNPAGQRDQLSVPGTDLTSKFANVKPLKVAGAYALNATRLTCNAPFPFTSGNSSVGADTTPPTILNLGWNDFGSDGDSLNGYLQSIQFYDVAFTENELEALVQ